MKIELDTLLENDIIESGKITELVCNGKTIWKGLSDEVENFAESYSFVKFNRDIKDGFNKPEYSIEVKSTKVQLVESKTEDPEYGVPEEKKFPLDSKEHVVSAIKFFNYVKPEYEEKLAKAIIEKMHKYNISCEHIGEDNRLCKYIDSCTADLSESRHTYYHTCEYCGANLDPGERCDCPESQGLVKKEEKKDDKPDTDSSTVKNESIRIPVTAEEEQEKKLDKEIKKHGTPIGVNSAGHKITKEYTTEKQLATVKKNLNCEYDLSESYEEEEAKAKKAAENQKTEEEKKEEHKKKVIRNVALGVAATAATAAAIHHGEDIGNAVKKYGGKAVEKVNTDLANIKQAKIDKLTAQVAGHTEKATNAKTVADEATKALADKYPNGKSAKEIAEVEKKAQEEIAKATTSKPASDAKLAMDEKKLEPKGSETTSTKQTSISKLEADEKKLEPKVSETTSTNQKKKNKDLKIEERLEESLDARLTALIKNIK